MAPGAWGDAPGQVDAAPDGSGPDAVVDAGVDGSTIDPTLIAHWKFDDPPNDGALDSSGRGHTGLCTACPEVVAGKVGTGYRFTAASAHVLRVPDHPDFRGVFTIAAWARPAVAAPSLSILAKPYGPGTGNSWQLEFVDSGKIAFSGGTPHSLDAPTPFAVATWYHLAGSWDGTTKRLYVNGVEVSSVASAISYDTHMVYLGADENNGNLALPFDGIIDDLRVYNRVLSVAEIQALGE